MSGIYIHIPFCKSRCIYCDFYSSVSRPELVDAYVERIVGELMERKDYLVKRELDTVYFGGGTPSQLSAVQLKRLLDAIIEAGFVIRPEAGMEITLEANPDDLTPAYLDSLRSLPFNRMSLGVQSFDDRDLHFLNRRHSAQAAREAVRRAQALGYDNLSIDLMYGLPGQSLEGWRATVRQAIELDVQHLSAYHLIYEEGTRMHELLEKGIVQSVDEELSLQLFELLIDELNRAGYEHYEISNFARPGYRSKHNSSYWTGDHYLGLGIAAHSYNGLSRQWNTPGASGSMVDYQPETEWLDEKMQYNDFILTRLRTKEGVDLNELASLFGDDRLRYCLGQAERHIRNKQLLSDGSRLHLSAGGIFVSDGIMSDLIV